MRCEKLYSLHKIVFFIVTLITLKIDDILSDHIAIPGRSVRTESGRFPTGKARKLAGSHQKNPKTFRSGILLP